MVWGKSPLIGIELNMLSKQHILIAQYPKRQHSLKNQNGYNYMQWKMSFNIFCIQMLDLSLACMLFQDIR